MTQVADILGGYAAAAQPNEIARVGVRFEDIGSTATSIRGDLAKIDTADWTGRAAAAFRQKQSNDIPGELSKLGDSFGIAGRALRSYASSLADILTQARTLAGQIDGAQQTFDEAHQNEHAARRTLGAARAAQATASDPVSSAQAQTGLNRAATAYGNAIANRETAENSLRRLQNSSQRLRDALTADARACAVALGQASEAGISNNLFSSFDRYVVDGVPGTIVSDAGKVIVTVAADAADVLDGVAKDISDFIEKNATIIELAVMGAAVLTIVALAVFAGPETLVLAPDILVAAGKIGTALDATKGTADTWLAIRGKGQWSAVEGDALSLGMDKLGNAIPDGKLTGEGQLDTASGKYFSSLDKYAQTGTPQALGWVTRRANGLIAPATRYVVVHSVLDLAEGKGSDMLKSFVVDHTKQLVDPLPTPLVGPIVGPFEGLTMGVSARVRATIESPGLTIGSCGW